MCIIAQTSERNGSSTVECNTRATGFNWGRFKKTTHLALWCWGEKLLIKLHFANGGPQTPVKLRD